MKISLSIVKSEAEDYEEEEEEGVEVVEEEEEEKVRKIIKFKLCSHFNTRSYQLTKVRFGVRNQLCSFRS